MSDSNFETLIAPNVYENNDNAVLRNQCKPPPAVVLDELLNNEPDKSTENSPHSTDDVVTLQHPNVENPIISDATPIHSPKRYYPGDVVMKKDSMKHTMLEWQPLFGTVLKPMPGSQMAKNLDKGSSDRFSVYWESNKKVQNVKASQVSIVDRMLLRGQKVENEKKQLGTIIDCSVTADVQVIGTHHVIENVDLNRLRPISPHVRGQEILFNGWAGVITSIKRNVWFRMDGGMIFYIETNESDGLLRTDPYWGLGVFCPGMRTRLSSSVLKSAKWISPSSKLISKWLPVHYLQQLAYNTVIRSEVTQVDVFWLQPAPGSSTMALQPSNKLTKHDLQKVLLIGTPSTETIGINSVRKLKIWPEDDLASLDSWISEFRNKFVDELDPSQYYKSKRSVESSLPTFNLNDENETPVKILLRNNHVTIEWENDLLEKIPAIKVHGLSPNLDDGEFPIGLVISTWLTDGAKGDDYGIIMESNDLAKSRSRMTNVRWIRNGKDGGKEQVSVFDIKPHNLYSMYQRGTIVFPRDASTSKFSSGVVTDSIISLGKMIVIRSSDNLPEEVYPHQVTALSKRCHWNFFNQKWVLDDFILPPYQLELEYDPSKRNLDISDQSLNVLDVDNSTPEDPSNFTTLWDEATFELFGFAPETHRFYKSASSNGFGKGVFKKIEKEHAIMREANSIPEGIWIRCYENRLDLVSVLMVGPSRTPYEDGLFLFDIQLSDEFPAVRPAVHYVSYTLEIHPLLSFDGNVCVSAIPWNVSDTTEHSSSYLCQFLGKLQELLFTPTPYCVDEQKKGELSTERGQIKTRLYNQGVVVRILDATWSQLQNPYDPWKICIRNHFASVLPDKIFGMENWINLVDDEEALSKDADNVINDELPTYPLLPIPLGFKVAVKPRIELFKKLINAEQLMLVDRVFSVNDTTADLESHSVEKPGEESTRCLTPIAEITEPSSTSTFDGKVSSVLIVPNQYPATSLDSLKNIKRHNKNKTTGATADSESEHEHLDRETNHNEPK